MTLKKMTSWLKPIEPTQDPLYVIFEHHLFNFQDSNIDRETFILNVIKEYLSFIRRQKISIPIEIETHITEELFAQVNTMLAKKIYGFMGLEDYQNTVDSDEKKKANQNYSKTIRKSR
ncbi:MAG: hypothetical protein CL678_17925 [Bdellovibrionaceae bacterium]|nr:hypothetical protein [Pseudobdellovibrionaceae bacterium]|tara:strand:+ start:1445 stop:1798 length:354 start_codon:yes stop_codon:yes gene_type:complete